MEGVLAVADTSRTLPRYLWAKYLSPIWPGPFAVQVFIISFPVTLCSELRPANSPHSLNCLTVLNHSKLISLDKCASFDLFDDLFRTNLELLFISYLLV